MSVDVPDYAELRDSFARWDVAIAPAELHGNICGVLCGAGDDAAQKWVGDIAAEHAHFDPDNARALSDLLQAVVAATGRELAAANMDFEPLLPDDDADLDEQASALAAYCHGFLAGLALGGATTEPPAGELAEILVDFAEISRAGPDDEERADRDAAGFALAELKEYVRVGVQLAFEQLRGRRAVATSAGSRTAH